MLNHRTPSAKYEDNASRDTGVNGLRIDGQRTAGRHIQVHNASRRILLAARGIKYGVEERMREKVAVRRSSLLPFDRAPAFLSFLFYEMTTDVDAGFLPCMQCDACAYPK